MQQTWDRQACTRRSSLGRICRALEWLWLGPLREVPLEVRLGGPEGTDRCSRLPHERLCWRQWGIRQGSSGGACRSIRALSRHILGLDIWSWACRMPAFCSGPLRLLDSLTGFCGTNASSTRAPYHCSLVLGRDPFSTCPEGGRGGRGHWDFGTGTHLSWLGRSPAACFPGGGSGKVFSGHRYQDSPFFARSHVQSVAGERALPSGLFLLT